MSQSLLLFSVWRKWECEWVILTNCYRLRDNRQGLNYKTLDRNKCIYTFFQKIELFVIVFHFNESVQERNFPFSVELVLTELDRERKGRGASLCILSGCRMGTANCCVGGLELPAVSVLIPYLLVTPSSFHSFIYPRTFPLFLPPSTSPLTKAKSIHRPRGRMCMTKKRRLLVCQWEHMTRSTQDYFYCILDAENDIMNFYWIKTIITHLNNLGIDREID